jgi:hypothetical protein
MRPRWFTASPQRGGKIVAGLGPARLEPHSVLECRRGLAEPALRGQDHAVVVVRLRHVGQQRERAADELGRIPPSQLVRHHAEQMECAGVVRITRAHEPIEAFGLVQAAGTVMRECGGKLVHGSMPGTGSRREWGPRRTRVSGAGSIP